MRKVSIIGWTFLLFSITALFLGIILYITGVSRSNYYYSDYLPETSSDKYKTASGLSKYPTEHVLFPIPQYEMDQNQAITVNNPGY